MLVAIFAHDQNHLIGNHNHLPWHLPNDLRFFRQQTVGHPVIMGRRTFESFGQHPLPKRQNIVVTRHPEQYHSANDQVRFVSDVAAFPGQFADRTAFVIGGAQLFQALWPNLDELRITVIDATFAGDTYFDPDLSAFRCYRVIEGTVDAKNPWPHRFTFWRRVQG